MFKNYILAFSLACGISIAAPANAWIGQAIQSAGKALSWLFRTPAGQAFGLTVGGMLYTEIAQAKERGDTQYTVKLCREDGELKPYPSRTEFCPLDASKPEPVTINPQDMQE